jgi:predicted GH43/DUF377 family glycosyl hydrolase
MRKYIICLFVVIAIFTQAYAQTLWVKDSLNPVFLRGTNGEWDDQFLSGPYVLFDGTGYHMWYGGYDGEGNGSRIGYAYSLNGINNWTRHPNPVLDSGPPGSWDAITVYQPCVFFDGITYHMWFGGHNGPTGQIGYATSPDSISWSKYSGNPVLRPGSPGTWDDEWVDSPDVLFINGVYHMWYSGSDGTYTQIGHATSQDGMIWEKDTLNPVLKVGVPGSWDYVMSIQPSVLFDGTTYRMWYSGGGGSFLWSIGYASSSDGIHWTKDSTNNPVLESGLSGSWDDTFVGLCVVIFDNTDSTRFKMWYAGGNGFVIGDIGYASSIITSIEDNNSSELPQGFSLSQNYPNPFNPSTTIEFSIPKSDKVTLKIYNILGQEVAGLLDQKLTPGNYNYSWDASGFTSGVYFYSIQTNNGFKQTKKLMLIK